MRESWSPSPTTMELSRAMPPQATPTLPSPTLPSLYLEFPGQGCWELGPIFEGVEESHLPLVSKRYRPAQSCLPRFSQAQAPNEKCQERRLVTLAILCYGRQDVLFAVGFSILWRNHCCSPISLWERCSVAKLLSRLGAMSGCIEFDLSVSYSHAIHPMAIPVFQVRSRDAERSLGNQGHSASRWERESSQCPAF